MEQVALVASVAPHPFSWVKEAPVIVMEVRVTVLEPVLESVTTCASLVLPVTVLGKLNEPGDKVTVGVEVIVPVPVRETLCGDPDALSATASEARSVPVAVGLNSSETVQVALTASDVPQVSADLMNEVALVPVRVSEVRVRAAVPVFLMVTVWAAVVLPTVVEAKVSEVGDRVTAGAAAAVPVPVRETLWGEPEALSAMASEAARVPVPVGLNSMETVQLALTANEVPQVSADLMYEDALVPVRFSEVRVRAAVPVFLMVTVWAAVVLPTVVEAKVSEVGDNVTAGAAAAVPVPVRETL